LIGNHSGETHRLGDPVTVKLIEVAPVAGALRFELLSEGRYDRGKRAERPSRNQDDRKKDVRKRADSKKQEDHGRGNKRRGKKRRR
jgi:ribonuclease R